MKFQIITLFIFTIVLLSLISIPVQAQTTETETPSVLPLEVINATQTPLNPQPGQQATLQVTIKNNDYAGFKDIIATIDLEEGDIPITTINSNLNLVRNLDYRKEATLIYNFLINPDATPGPYNIPLKIQFTDPRNEIFTITHFVGFIIQTQPEYKLTVEEATQTNQGLKLGISIYNTGTGTMKYITTAIQETEYIKLNSLNEQYLGNLDSDEFETATYYITPQKTNNGKFPLTITLEYHDNFNKIQKFNKTIQIPKNYELLTSETETTQSYTAFLTGYFFLGLSVIALSFMTLMLVDVKKQPKPKNKKIMCRIIILTETGTIIYYFIGRKKK